MPKIDLFTPRVESIRFHPIFAMLLQDQYGPERAVLEAWAEGFRDRDGKFVQEFQTTFESSLWELYLNACLRALGLKIDFAFDSPDFVVTSPTGLIVEGTITAPAAGGKPAYGYDSSEIPTDFNEFNRQASLRICNSFDSKIKRYRDYYSTLSHARNKPYAIAIGAYDRPLAHMAASRPILAAIYGLYYDEETTIAQSAPQVISYPVEAVVKSETTDIPVGLFCTDNYADVSAVLYSSLTTWGKVRALADNPIAQTVYTTFHPNTRGLNASVKRAIKKDYREDLLDGMYVLHNPFANEPIPHGVLSHARVAEIRVSTDGQLQVDSPDDFLLMRQLMSVTVKP